MDGILNALPHGAARRGHALLLLTAALTLAPLALDAQRKPGATLRVTVYDDVRGTRLATASATLENLGVAGQLDSTGNAVFEGIPSGTHTLRVQLAGYRRRVCRFAWWLPRRSTSRYGSRRPR